MPYNLNIFLTAGTLMIITTHPLKVFLCHASAIYSAVSKLPQYFVQTLNRSES
jgi:hypothetical protein